MSPGAAPRPVDGRSGRVLALRHLVLYEMITWQNFRSPRPPRSRRRGACRRASTRPSSCSRPDVQKGVCDIVKKMLARDAKERFTDAGRLHDELLGYFYAAGERFGANDPRTS
ncbi:MAG: hypothetical protein R3F14_05100 [Polyangiaceae bacterium]